jgi:alkylation response protein AidB-like acyl-CoA dehydrogenase
MSRTSSDVAVDPAAGLSLGRSELASSLQRLLLAADALGGVRRMLDRTVAYAKDRIAFGKPIGAFQAVQHRLSDHAVSTRGMALLVSEAARAIGAEAAGGQRRIALAEVSVSSNAGRILNDLVQLTGAIGFTWEHGLHHFVRRAHQDARVVAAPRAAERALIDLEGRSA